jgi:hypothetical protein
MKTSIQNLNNNKQTITTKTTTMKTLTLTMTSLFISLLMTFTSCSKNQEMINPAQPNDVLSQDFLTDLENMSYEYTTDQGQRIWPIIAGLAVKDAGTALIMYIADQDLELWQYALGGAVGSCFRATDVAGTNGNPMPWSGNIGSYLEKTKLNPNNYQEMTGQYHNSYVSMITNECVKNKSTIYTAAESIANLTNGRLPSEKDFNALTTTFLKCSGEIDVLNYINNSTFPKAYKLILTNYISTLYNAKSVAAFQQYSVNVENMVAAHKGLKKETKDGLLLTMSIAKHSANLWSSVL